MILSKRNVVLLIVLTTIVAVFLYVTEFKSKPIGWQPDEVVLMDEPPAEVLNPQGQINFGNELPKGFPSDMPIDPEPVRVLQSYTASSQNPPPKLNYDQITYSYITRRDAKETFEVLTDYAVLNGFTIESEEKVDRALSLSASRGDDEKLNITVYDDNVEVVVTITISKKQSTAL